LDIFAGLKGRPLEARARLVLDLVELQQTCRPSRAWITPDEWAKTWCRGRAWNGLWDSPRRALFRLQRELWRIRCPEPCRRLESGRPRRDCVCGRAQFLGVELKVESDEGSLRIYVDTPAIAELVEPHFLEARRIDHRASERKRIALERARGDEPRAPEELEDLPVTIPVIAEGYRDKKFSFRNMGRRHGMSKRLIKTILDAAKQKIRGKGRLRVEEQRPPELVERALLAWDAGGSICDVARLLRCRHTSARRFLKRHGRRRRRPPPAEPAAPGVSARSDPRACAPWATSA
jgi:hypothetical protein